MKIEIRKESGVHISTPMCTYTGMPSQCPCGGNSKWTPPQKYIADGVLSLGGRIRILTSGEEVSLEHVLEALEKKGWRRKTLHGKCFLLHPGVDPSPWDGVRLIRLFRDPAKEYGSLREWLDAIEPQYVEIT